MKIDASVVYHYLYGYQPMRLASQEDINSIQCPGKQICVFLGISTFYIQTSVAE